MEQTLGTLLEVGSESGLGPVDKLCYRIWGLPPCIASIFVVLRTCAYYVRELSIYRYKIASLETAIPKKVTTYR